jgi:hypothetical protein
LLLLATIAATGVLATTMTLKPEPASAAVCAAGVYRAGCVGPNGAVVVRRAPVACQYRYVWVNGVRVRRCL